MPRSGKGSKQTELSTQTIDQNDFDRAMMLAQIHLPGKPRYRKSDRRPKAIESSLSR